MADKTKRLMSLFKKERETAQAIEKEVQRLYPVGTIIRFRKKADHKVVCEVIRHGNGTKLFVRNIHTKKEYDYHVSQFNWPEVI